MYLSDNHLVVAHVDYASDCNECDTRLVVSGKERYAIAMLTEYGTCLVVSDQFMTCDGCSDEHCMPYLFDEKDRARERCSELLQEINRTLESGKSFQIDLLPVSATQRNVRALVHMVLAPPR